MHKKRAISYAHTEKRNRLLVGGVIAGVLLLLGAYLLLFVYESPVTYREGIIEASIPVDGGIDIYISLGNYKRSKTVLVETGEGCYDLYVGITQTAATNFLKADHSDMLLRVGNGIVVDFHTEQLLEYIPNGYGADAIQRIYYVDDLSDERMTMTGDQLMKYDAKTLIWER